MACLDESFRGFLLIQQITQRSELIYCIDFHTNRQHSNRVLIATIRDKGVCPCPRCFMPKSRFDQLGLKADISARIKSVRLYLRDKVFAAREALYKLGAPIKGAAAERLLKAFSLVPTLVSAFSCRPF